MLQVCSSQRLSAQVSATSCFGLLQNHERGSYLAVRNLFFFQLPSLLVHFSTLVSGFAGGSGVLETPKLPLAALQLAPAIGI